MYRVLLVDDEINVIKVLRKLIDWGKYGFEVIADAPDGAKAMDIVDRLRPDLVIADVDMPYLNGIQLIRRIAEEGYGCKTLLLTVYKDFQYIKSAMDYGAMGYLLKPVDEGELAESLMKVRKKLDGNKIFSEAFQLYKERLLRSFLEGREEFEEEGVNKAELGITFSENDAFAVMVAEIDDVFDINPGEVDIEGVYRTISGVIDNIVNRTLSGCSFRDNMERICVLLWYADKSKLESEAFDIAEELRSAAGEKTGLSITLGMSPVKKGSGNLKYLYGEAVRAVETAFLLGKGRVIRNTECIRPGNAAGMGECGGLLAELCRCIESFDHVNADRIIDEIFGLVIRDKIGEKDVKKFAIVVLVEIGKVIKECNGDINDVFGDDADILAFLRKRSTIQECRDWLGKIANDCCRYLKGIKTGRPKSVVAEVIDYIRRNYSRNLTLKGLAEMFYISPLYLGQIFKKDTGESFNDFLARVRIENAVRFLKNTDMKVYEIAEKVGFKEIQYYYKTFKKITGASPTAFRSNM